MKIYLAGPMRGKKLHNFPAFMTAAMVLRRQGHYVLNPAERDIAVGFNAALPIDHLDNIEVFSIEEAFDWDFEAIKSSDGIALLPGWGRSKGVQAELVLAIALGKEVYLWEDDDVLQKLKIKDYTVEFDLG